MGKKGNWFSSIRKTLSPRSKEKKIQKSEQKGFVDERSSVPDTPIIENASGYSDSHPIPPPEEVEVEPPQAAIVATTVASTSVVAVTTRYAGISREEVSAIKIQTVFRGYMARRALWGLRGLVRLKTLVEGPCVKRQTVNTLKCIQTLSHMQSQIRSRRIRMLEESQALQKQLLRAKEIVNMQNGGEWDDSVQSKEEIEARLMNKYDAAMRRERAMAYSFSHQQLWKKSGGTRTTMLFMDPTNPQWGWSWSERHKHHGNDHVSVKSGTDIKSEITKSYARHQLNSAPSTPRAKGGGGLVASPKPKMGGSYPRGYGSGIAANLDDDSKSVSSVKSEINRRYSVAGSMVVAKSPKVNSRGLAENGGGTANAKKHLSFQAKPRRHSGPPKVETTVGDGLEEGNFK